MPTQEWIRATLKEKGFKLKDVAERLKIAPPRVSDILRGAREVQSDEVLPLSEMLGLSPQSLLKSLGQGRKVVVPDATGARLDILGQLTGDGTVLPLPADLPFKSVPVPPDAESPDGLCCYIMGDQSMDREIKPGSLVIAADPRQHFFPMVPGAIFLVRVGDDKLALRQYVKTPDGGDWLVPQPTTPNPAFTSWRFSLVPDSLLPGAPAPAGTGTETGAQKTLHTDDIVAAVLWVHRQHMPTGNA